LNGLRNMNRKRCKFTCWFLIISIFHFTTVVPSAAFTIGEERELGEKLLYSVRSAFTIIEDPDISQYINRIGQDVLEVTGIQYFDYHFFVINNKEFNAFAAPSGLLFFHSGLIGAMDSEDELVSVIAHEIGHIVKRHLAARMETGKYSSMASLGLAIAAIAFGGVAAPALLTGALATGQSINLHYSRLHEEEADLLAYGWMKQLHRDPGKQLKMLETMRRIARYRSDRLPQYLLTHPNPEARLHYIEALVDSDTNQNIGKTVESNNFDFMRFKYRILSQVRDTDVFKASLASIVADNRSSQFKKNMAYYGLSQIFKNGNDFKQALVYLQKVIDYFPHEDILLVDKGVILFNEGQYGEAEKILEEALDNDSSDMYATFTLGRLMYRIGKLTEAESYLKTVTYHMPECPQAYFELGKIAANTKQTGLSSYYLGKYYLYEGRLKLAGISFKKALRDNKTPEPILAESKQFLKKIKRLQK
jgi:predicted Zn-dependent protease